MSRDPKLYLADIVEACRKIERIASGRDDDQLMSDEIVRDALLYSIVVIGEAAGRIPPDLQAAFPTIASCSMPFETRCQSCVGRSKLRSALREPSPSERTGLPETTRPRMAVVPVGRAEDGL